MLLTLLALAGVLFVLEETLSRLLRHAWTTTRWIVLPAAGVSVTQWVPVGLFGHPAILDLYTSILLGIAAAALIAVHGAFRDAHWKPLGQKPARRPAARMPNKPKPSLRVAPTGRPHGTAVRAPLKTRP